MKYTEENIRQFFIAGSNFAKTKFNESAKLEISKFNFKENELSIIRDREFENISFNECKFENVIFKNVRFKNCSFLSSKFTLFRFEMCDIVDCTFKNCKMKYFFMDNIGRNAGKITDTIFEKCNFKNLLFRFPIISRCNFFNCKYSDCDLDGSILSDCCFKGDIEDLIMGGVTTKYNDPFWRFFNRFNPNKDLPKYKNKMDNIDFSEANMIGVYFYNGIDLSRCKLPKGEKYIKIENIETTGKAIRQHIIDNWSEIIKKEALFLLDNYFFSPAKNTMPFDFWSVESKSNIQYVTIQKDILQLMRQFAVPATR
jgi:uncharacterized protein YjbI with pentapeptide repeats